MGDPLDDFLAEIRPDVRRAVVRKYGWIAALKFGIFASLLPFCTRVSIELFLDWLRRPRPPGRAEAVLLTPRDDFLPEVRDVLAETDP